MNKILMALVILLSIVLCFILFHIYKEWFISKENYRIWKTFIASQDAIDKKTKELKIELIIMEVKCMISPNVPYRRLSIKDKNFFKITQDKIRKLEKERSELPGPFYKY